MAATESKGTITRALPRGKNAASREVVMESQRARLTEAMVKCAAARGFINVTIAEIINTAGVGKQTFYEHFASKEDCLAAAYDEIFAGLIESVTEVLDPDAGSEERILAGLKALLKYLAADDDRARVFLIECANAGPLLAARVTNAHSVLADFYIGFRETVRAHDSKVAEISKTRAMSIVGAINEPVIAALRAGGADSILLIEDEIVGAVLLLAGVESVGRDG
jgi:AcrR family transcriptional regulator